MLGELVTLFLLKETIFKFPELLFLTLRLFVFALLKIHRHSLVECLNAFLFAFSGTKFTLILYKIYKMYVVSF